MINFSFGLSNPFSHRWDTIYYRDRLFKNNKGGEVQVVRDSNIISFAFRFTTRCDHAGVSLDFGLLGYSIMFNYYDTRHWNYDFNTWEKYSGQEIKHT